MCLMIYRPKGKTVTKERLNWGYVNNPDGVGMAYVDDGQLMVDKSLYTFDEWYKAYEALGDRDLLIHFRKASPGMEVKADMCHPFVFDSGEEVQTGEGENVRPRYEFALAHNGKLKWPDRKPKSDTACFVEDVVHPLLSRDPWFLDEKCGVSLMEMAITTDNAIAIMRYDVEDNQTDVYILNPLREWAGRVGHYLDGCWFSNHSYIERTHPYHPQGEFGYDLDDWRYMFPKEEELGWETHAWKVDKNGWKWFWKKECWINVRDGKMEDTLPYRAWPEYFRDKKGRKDIIVVNPTTIPALPQGPMAGLVQHEKLSLQRIAIAYGKKALQPGSKPSANDLMQLLRDDVRLAFPEAMPLNDPDLDKWIIHKDFRSNGGSAEWIIDAQKNVVMG